MVLFHQRRILGVVRILLFAVFRIELRLFIVVGILTVGIVQLRTLSQDNVDVDFLLFVFRRFRLLDRVDRFVPVFVIIIGRRSFFLHIL